VDPPQDDDTLKRLVETKLALPMCKPAVKAAVIVLFAIIGTLGFIGAISIKVQADVNVFLPAGSYLKDYFNVRKTIFTTTGDPTGEIT
jgi:hypothetical protein